MALLTVTPVLAAWSPLIPWYDRLPPRVGWSDEPAACRMRALC